MNRIEELYYEAKAETECRNSASVQGADGHNNGIQKARAGRIDPNRRMIDLNTGDHVATIKD